MSEKIPTWTPENLRKQTQRAKSDGQLINEGAEYVLDDDAHEPRLDVNQKGKGKARVEMEENLKSGRINRYLEFMENEMHSSINPDDKEALEKIKLRIQSDKNIIQDAVFEGNEWKVVFKDGAIQKAEHEMISLIEGKKSNERLKKWNERVEELNREYPETMRYMMNLPGSCTYCTNGSPTNWGDEFDDIVEKETGLDAGEIENAIRYDAKEYKEAGGFDADDIFYAESIDRCSSLGEKGVMSILSALLNARKNKKIDW